MKKEDIAGYNSEAEKLVRKAQDKIKGSALGNIFSSKSDRIEEGLELYKKALDNYKLAKNWVECAIINQECARLSLAIKESKQAANFSAEAGDFFMKAKEEERAVGVYKEAVNALKENGSFDQAANLQKKIGEYYEREEELETAASYFKGAADLYGVAKYHTTDATKMQLKVAEIYSQQFDNPERLKEAIHMYEEVAEGYLANNLMRFHSKDLFTRAVIIFLLLDDDIGAEKSLEKYSDLDPSLNNSYELKFLRNIIKAARERKADDYSDACAQLMKRVTIDNTFKSLLTQVKQNMEKGKSTIEEDNPL